MYKRQKDQQETIRYSTDIDLEEILRWLSEQNKNEIKDTFYCNQNLTIESHNEGKLLVYIDPMTNKPIAYQWGGLITPGILEVRVDKHGQGIGKELVKYRIKEARDNDICCLKIQCEPETSIPFWQKMGFILYGNKNYAYKLVDTKRELPQNGHSCKVKISVYPENRKREEHTAPINVFTPSAIKTPDNIIWFSERVPLYHSHEVFNNIISIHFENQQIYLGETVSLRYDPKAKALGVKMCCSVFYLDKLNLNLGQKRYN